jgi:hypothetical protein
VSTHFVAHRGLSLVVAVAILSAGCATTQLTVENVEKVTNGASVVGQIYYLPRVEFGIEVERELVACGEVADPLEVETRVKVTPYVLPDLSAVYRIDYQGMRGAFKATEYTLETYPNGTLKSLNTKLDDQTGDAIRGYLNGALRLAAAVPTRAQPPAGVINPPEADTSTVPCNSKTFDHLNERAELKQKIASQEPSLHKAEQVLLDAEARLAIAQQALANARTDNRSGAYLAKRKQDVEDLQVARDAALRARNSAKSALGATSERLVEVRKALTVTGVHHFRPSLPDQSKPVQEQVKPVREQVKPVQEQVKPVQEQVKPVQEPINAGLDEAISVWIAATPHNGITCDTNGSISDTCASLRLSVAVYQSPGVTRNAIDDAPKDGLVYRQPVEGLLMICAEKDCLAADGAIQVESRQTVLMSKVSVPQLGFPAALPLVNKAFQNNSLQAAFAEDGALTKVSYVSNARAAKQANVFAESADSLLKFAEAKRAQPQESLNAELAKARARTQLVEATLALERANRELESFRSGESDGAAGNAEGE